MNEVESVKITTVVDNEVWKEELVSSWGLSFYVETFTGGEKYNVLMDTDGSFQIFFGNASKLGLICLRLNLFLFLTSTATTAEL